MGRLSYNYDEEGNTFLYFVLIVYGFIIVSVTYYFIKSFFSRNVSSDKKKKEKECTCDGCLLKQVYLKKLERPTWKRKRFILLALGWILFSFIAYAAWNARTAFPEGYDPYTILGLSVGASEAEIKKHYKSLSLKYHPDRVSEDMKEEAEEKFISISKAYKILTDEDIRKNFEETGNPDGIHNYTLGIALPSWLVEKGNIIKVLSAYVLAFMIVLPMMVWRWWRKAKKYTKNNIHFTSMARYFQEIQDHMSVKKIIEILTASYEFQEKFIWTQRDTQLISPLYQKIKNEIEAHNGEKYEKSKKFNAPFCTKSFVLLMAHLYRLPIDPQLLEDQRYVIEKCFHLTSGILQISLARDYLNTATTAITLGQMIIQAVYDPTLYLLQLPGINEEILKAWKAKKRFIKTVKDLNGLEESDRRNLLESLSDQEYANCIRVSNEIPKVVLVKSFVEVLGQDNITCKSVISALFYVVLTIPEDDEKAIANIPISKDEDLFSVNMKSGESRRRSDGYFNRKSLVHAPFYPLEKDLQWWGFLRLIKTGKLVTGPIKIGGLPLARDFLSNIENSSSKNLDPIISIQFRAPAEPGSYHLSLDLRPDSYLGIDFHHEFKLQVVAEKPSSKTSPAHHQAGDFSDEEDSDDDMPCCPDDSES